MGDAFSRLLHTGFGLAAVLFPLVGLGWGIALLRDRSPEERMRMFIGFVVMALGVLGLVSILRGNPSVFAPAVDTKVRGAGVTPGFSDAGGFFGTLGAYPLSKVVSPAGAFLVDLGLAVIGTLIMTGTSFAELGRKFAATRASLAEKRETKAVDEQAKAEAAIEKQRLKDERAVEKAAKPAEKGTKAKLTERLGLTEPVVVLPDSEALGALGPPSRGVPRPRTHRSLRSRAGERSRRPTGLTCFPRSTCCARRRLPRTTACTRRTSWRRWGTRSPRSASMRR